MSTFEFILRYVIMGLIVTAIVYYTIIKKHRTELFEDEENELIPYACLLLVVVWPMVIMACLTNIFKRII